MPNVTEHTLSVTLVEEHVLPCCPRGVKLLSVHDPIDEVCNISDRLRTDIRF